MQSACHAHPILLVSTILDFSICNFQTTVFTTFCCLLDVITHNMIDMIAKMLYKVLQIVLGGFEIMSHKKLCQFLWTTRDKNDYETD